MTDGIFQADQPQIPDAVAGSLLNRNLPFAERQTGFAENFTAGQRLMRTRENASAGRYNRFESYEQLVDQLNQDRPEGVRPFRNPERARAATQALPPSPGLATVDVEEARIWQEIQRRRAADPEALPGVPDSAEAFEAAILERIKAETPELQGVNRQAGTGGEIGFLLGSMAGALEDDLNLLTLGIGAPASAGIGRAMLTEFVIGGGVEVANAPVIADYYDALGEEFTAGDLALNIATAGGAAAGFTGVVRGAPEAVRLVLGKRERGEQVTDAERAAAAAEVRGLSDGQALRLLKRVAPTEAVRGVVSRAEESLRRLRENRRVQKTAEPAAAAAVRNPEATAEAARQAIESGREPPPPTALTAPATEDWRTLNGSTRQFRPDELTVDAQRFQFKSGGDDFGVTERLKGVRKWDPLRANAGIVWIDEAGQAFIVDGHQRLALARRIVSQGDGQEPLINAFVLRASDGVTDAEAMARAAMKNLAEGTGTGVDAAKVLRSRPELLDASVPRNSANVRHGMALSNLDNEAFDLVVNRLVPEEHAAVIGRLAEDDPALQLALMRLFAQEPVESVGEAEALARQFIDNRTPDQTIDDLFGSMDVADSAFRERARVLSRAVAQLRRERTLFGTVARNADTLAAAGNRLDTGNAARAQQAAEATEAVQRLANRKGPVADALNAAAKTAKETGRYETPVKEFADVIRRAIADGDVGRLTDGGAGGADAAARALGELQGVEGQPEPGAPARGAAPPEEPADGLMPPEQTAPPGEAEAAALDLFGEPAGRGQQDQLAGLEAQLADLPDDLEVPIATRLDADGETISETVTVQALREEQAADQDFLEVLDVCGTGGSQ